MRVVGRTENGSVVMGGLFEMHDTRGLPLSMSLLFLKRRGMVPDLYGYVTDALLHGWSPKSIRVRVREAVVDVHGMEYWLDIEPKIDRIFDLFMPLVDKVSL